MKKIHKKSSRFFAVLVLLGILCMPAAVLAEGNKVYDNYGILSAEETSQLQSELSDIGEKYDFETVFLISEDVGEDLDYREYAAEFMQKNQVGYGDTNEGMCVFHQPDARNITIVFRGNAQYEFTEKIQDIMLDHCTEKLKEEDTFGAYQSLVEDLEKGLARTSDGKKIRPMDISQTPFVLAILKWFAISVLLGAVPAFVASWYQKNRMKTNIPQTNADMYADGQGTEFSEMRDMFIQRTVTRRRKPENNNQNGGSSGSFTSGGESFSGSSRDY